MPPFLIAAAGVIGAIALARVLTREARRVNDILDTRRTPGDDAPAERLERDPATGEYRPRPRG
ncbi:hypothetical protein J5J86_05880 [Aquabacter sp. L1I39]|uniref:hypothetical protein n=1 Tax=Aquabacter sp. L1I39 TaxID=2820278 RepID=UPI001ADCBE9B|nr:hypothetical protein [Aquabacter sp. L1I39]QTL04846.1 hypothetical protein J5J86_05880 [Aquabacter sp. L1I39]